MSPGATIREPLFLFLVCASLSLDSQFTPCVVLSLVVSSLQRRSSGMSLSPSLVVRLFVFVPLPSRPLPFSFFGNRVKRRERRDVTKRGSAWHPESGSAVELAGVVKRRGRVRESRRGEVSMDVARSDNPRASVFVSCLLDSVVGLPVRFSLRCPISGRPVLASLLHCDSL